MDDPWNGEHNPERHRTCGKRSWCLCCIEWCYPDDWCDCCHEAAGHRKVWLVEEADGVSPKEADNER